MEKSAISKFPTYCKPAQFSPPITHSAILLSLATLHSPTPTTPPAAQHELHNHLMNNLARIFSSTMDRKYSDSFRLGCRVLWYAATQSLSPSPIFPVCPSSPTLNQLYHTHTISHARTSQQGPHQSSHCMSQRCRSCKPRPLSRSPACRCAARELP
jgi:hypothetical protein